MVFKKKYGERLVIRSFAIPTSVLNYAESLGGKENKSVNEIVISLILSADKDVASQILNNIDNLQIQLKKTVKLNKELTNENKQLLNKLDKININKSWFKKIYNEPTELEKIEVKKCFEKYKNEFLIVIKNVKEEGLKENLINNWSIILTDRLVEFIRPKIIDKGNRVFIETYFKELLKEVII